MAFSSWQYGIITVYKTGLSLRLFLFSRYVYVYCENAKQSPETGFEFEIKPYTPQLHVLQDLAAHLKNASEGDAGVIPPWLSYLKQGIEALGSQSEHEFNAPPSDSDKLYMSIGERDLIEVAHPVPQDSAIKRYLRFFVLTYSLYFV